MIIYHGFKATFNGIYKKKRRGRVVLVKLELFFSSKFIQNLAILQLLAFKLL